MNNQLKSFRVAAVSKNTNSFGLRQYIMVARDGEAFSVLCNDLIKRYPWQKGADVNVPLDSEFRPFWARLGAECGESISRPNAKLLAEIYPDQPEQPKHKIAHAVRCPGGAILWNGKRYANNEDGWALLAKAAEERGYTDADISTPATIAKLFKRSQENPDLQDLKLQWAGAVINLYQGNNVVFSVGAGDTPITAMQVFCLENNFRCSQIVGSMIML